MKRVGQLQLAIILIIGLMVVGTPLVMLHNQHQESDLQEQYLALLDKGAVEFEIAATTLSNYQFYDLQISYKDSDNLVFTNLGEASAEADAAIATLKANQPFCNAMLILGNEAIADSVHVSKAEVGFSLMGLNPTEKATLYFDPSHQIDEQAQAGLRIDGDWVLEVAQQ